MRSFRVLLAALATVVLCAIADAVACFAWHELHRSVVESERIRLGGRRTAAIRHAVRRYLRLRCRRQAGLVHGEPVLQAAKRPLPVHRGLYVTSGPWFAGFFNPAAVAKRLVGTLQFDAGSVDTATLTYSVDGLFVTKSIQRQLWTYEDFSGSYYGGLSTIRRPARIRRITVTSSNSGRSRSASRRQTFSLALQSNFGNCSIAGNYSQLGHMGTVDANYSCGTASTAR